MIDARGGGKRGGRSSAVDRYIADLLRDGRSAAGGRGPRRDAKASRVDAARDAVRAQRSGRSPSRDLPA